MQKFALSVFVCLAFIYSGQSQENIKSFVLSNAVPISTIESDADFEAIGQAIGDAQIVMLGEQDHGDAPTLLAKKNLVKYLHEKKGFDVLAFESDFFALTQGWDNLPKTRPVMDSFLRKNIFPIWTYCYTCESLFFDYIPSTYSTSKPLTVSGFDSQVYMEYSYKYMGKGLDSVFRALDLPITHQPDYDTELLAIISPLKFYDTKDSSKYSKVMSVLKTIKTQASQKLAPDNYWMMIIDNLIAENGQFQLLRLDYQAAGTIRDAQMAENLKWLKKNKYPNQKIIVWAANAHISKYGGNYAADVKKNKVTYMGKFFTSDSSLCKQTYILGFTSYEGEAGRLGMKKFTVRKPQSNGFENWITKSQEFAFVDFKTYNNKFPGNNEQFYLKGLDHHSAFTADWTKIFDGIFFIRHMYSCIQ